MSVDDSAAVESDIVIYPNPTSDYINIATDQLKVVTVLDFTGKTLLRSSSKKADRSNLPKGIYLLNVTLNNGRSISRKLIKN